MDGINGMTGGYSLIVLSSLIYINQTVVEFIDIRLLVYSLIAVIIFICFNFRNRAKCFAGDVGSLSIGFILVFLILKLIFKTGHSYWMALLAVYAVDGGLTIAHRIMLRENILKPHKKHAYQIMVNELKMPHLMVSGIYMVFQLVCNVCFIAMPSDGMLILLVAIFSVIYLLFMKKFYYLHAINKK